MKQLLFLTVLIVALASCEKPDDPPEDYSFNGEWEYRIDPAQSSFTIRVVIRDDIARLIEYPDPSYSDPYVITSSVIDGDTLRVQARNDEFCLNFISYFTNDKDIMWGRMMRGYEYKPIRYDISPLKFIRE